MAANVEAPRAEAEAVSDARVVLAIGLLATAFVFTGLDRYGVVNADEAIYHGIAEHMVETGDWLHLDFRGEPRVYDAFMNAPLHYWARAVLISLLDSTRFTMRALSALFGVLTVLATWGLARRLGDRRDATLGALVQLTTFHFVYLHGARTGELDTLVSFLLVGAAWTLLRAAQEGRSFVPHHLAVSALLMTKAPLALVPVAASLAILVASAEGRRLLPRYLATGAAIAPLALSWHATQAFLHADRVGDVLGSMLGQASGSAPDGEALGVAGNARFYAGVLLYGAYPWSLAYPFALLHALWPGPARAELRRVLAFAGALAAFFLVVSKHFPWYVMPVYPFLSVAVGRWLADLTRGAPRAAWGVGFVAGGLATLRVALGENPFGERALTYPMQTGWWEAGPLAAAAGIAVGGAAGLALALLPRGPARAGRGIALGWAIAATLLALATLRGVAPLSHLDHEAPIESARRELDRAAREGTQVRYPVRLRRPVIQIARFHFGEDHEIVPVYAPGGTDVELHPAGDPAVLDRSIGRAGLERRLAPVSRPRAPRRPEPGARTPLSP